MRWVDLNLSKLDTPMSWYTLNLKVRLSWHVIVIQLEFMIRKLWDLGNNGWRPILLDLVQKSIWGPVKWQVISGILILFNLYGFFNKSSTEVIKLPLNPFITNASSVSDGKCETKHAVSFKENLTIFKLKRFEFNGN